MTTSEGDVIMSVACGCIVTDAGRKHIAISPCSEHRERSDVMDALSNVVTLLGRRNVPERGTGGRGDKSL